MAFVAGAVGGLLGGGLLGNIAVAAIGIGINLAIAYFFPQKIKGPRAESLKAQTSKYGDHLARIYGTDRTAGAVVWLKDNKVDEHVTTERQGKALGPEVTSYTYTATFAVAFAWNGPFSAIPRIWADDKLIYDVSADSLQDAIDNGGTAIGVAEGATVTIYLGTDDQGPDPDIEADRGAGNVPAWPKVCYIVVKDLPLDEFGIRVPNIEAELVRISADSTFSVTPTQAGIDPWQFDSFGDYFVTATGTTMYVERLPNALVIRTNTLPHSVLGLHITATNKIIVQYVASQGIGVYDAATGAALQQLPAGAVTPVLNASIDDISINGSSYVFIFTNDFSASGTGFSLTCLVSSGPSYVEAWTENTDTNALLNTVDQIRTLSASASRIYGTTDWVFAPSKDIIVIGWSAFGVVSASTVTLSALAGNARSCFYDDTSDSVVVIDDTGSIYVYTASLGTLLRSVTNSFALQNNDQPQSTRLKVASNEIFLKVEQGAQSNDVYLYRLSDLTVLEHIDADTSGWNNVGTTTYYQSGFNPKWRMIFTTGGVATEELWFLPRAGRAGEPLANVLDAECRLVGMVPNVSLITTEIKGYGERSGSAPRAVIEDLIRVNFVDFAQVDGVITFFPRNTASMRTLTLAETGLALNAEPEAVQIKEDYPAALDIPEQVIIQYTSWDAIYRTGSQAANPEEDQPFPDEPSEADESGFPVKVRKKRFLEFATAQVLGDDEAAKVADLMHNELQDAGTVYKTTAGPKQLTLYPGLVINVPLDDTRVAKTVVTKMSGETIIELELRKRGDSYESEAVGQPTPYVIDSVLGIATAAPVLIDGHLMRSDDDDDAFYAGIAVTGAGQFRSGTLFQSEDGGSTYQPWASFTNGTIQGIALDVLPDRPHSDAFDRTTSFNIAVANGTAPDSVSEESLLASETSNAFAVWDESVGDWEYIRAASVVDNLDGTWTLSTLLRGRKGTEFAMAGHAVGAIVYHLDTQAIARATDADRTLSRIYVATPSSTRFNSAGAVTFTNTGKGLRPWAPQLMSAIRDSGSGDWTFTWNRRDRLGQEWPEDGAEDPPMSEDTDEYTINFYSGVTLVGTYTSATESYVYSSADQTSDFGSPQTTMPTIGIAQVSVIYGDGIELREAA